MKRTDGYSVRIRKTSVKNIVEGSAPSETEETAHKLRAGDVGAPATLGRLPAPTERRIFIVWILLCHDVEKKVDGSIPKPTCTLSGNRSGRAALRREQQEQLESNHREKWATERKVRPITDVTSTALRGEEMAARLYAIRDE
jgi:hypothetical protein